MLFVAPSQWSEVPDVHTFRTGFLCGSLAGVPRGVLHRVCSCRSALRRQRGRDANHSLRHLLDHSTSCCKSGNVCSSVSFFFSVACIGSSRAAEHAASGPLRPEHRDLCCCSRVFCSKPRSWVPEEGGGRSDHHRRGSGFSLGCLVCFRVVGQSPVPLRCRDFWGQCVARVSTLTPVKVPD